MKASYFLMFEKLVQDSYIEYEKYIRTIDPAVPKSFPGLHHRPHRRGRRQGGRHSLQERYYPQLHLQGIGKAPDHTGRGLSLYPLYSVDFRFLCKIRSQFRHKFYAHPPGANET